MGWYECDDCGLDVTDCKCKEEAEQRESERTICKHSKGGFYESQCNWKTTHTKLDTCKTCGATVNY